MGYQVTKRQGGYGTRMIVDANANYLRMCLAHIGFVLKTKCHKESTRFSKINIQFRHYRRIQVGKTFSAESGAHHC